MVDIRIYELKSMDAASLKAESPVDIYYGVLSNVFDEDVIGYQRSLREDRAVIVTSVIIDL